MNVVLEEEKQSTPVAGQEYPRGIAALVIRAGLARDARGAGRVMLILSGLAILIALGIAFGLGRHAPTKQEWLDTLTPSERAQFQETFGKP